MMNEIFKFFSQGDSKGNTFFHEEISMKDTSTEKTGEIAKT